jgi:hypothetical protein
MIELMQEKEQEKAELQENEQEKAELQENEQEKVELQEKEQEKAELQENEQEKTELQEKEAELFQEKEQMRPPPCVMGGKGELGSYYYVLLLLNDAFRALFQRRLPKRRLSEGRLAIRRSAILKIARGLTSTSVTHIVLCRSTPQQHARHCRSRPS